MTEHGIEVPTVIGTVRLGPIGIEELDQLLEQAYQKGREDLPWEYSPGHRWVDRDGEEHWFVQSGIIAPGYVSTYVEEGGEVVRRRVGPYEEVQKAEEEK